MFLGVSGPSFFSFGWVQREGFSMWRVDCSLFTFQLDNGHSTVHASFSFALLGGGSKQRVPRFLPQRAPHSTSFLSHLLWQMLSSFHLYR